MIKALSSKAEAVTASDSADLSQPSALYIGTGGNVKVTTYGGSTVTYKNVSDGSYLNVIVVKVFDTDTTASDMIAEHE